MARLEPFVLLDEVLKRDQKLAPLLAQARLHMQLLAKIRQALPEPSGSHCLYCVLRGDSRLILYVDSAAWATKLRFHQLEIQSALSEIGPLKSIQIRVLLPGRETEKRLQAAKIPSPQALDQLAKIAAASCDPEIKRSLKRLVCTLQRAAQSRL